MTKFLRVTINGWRQFGHVDIELHPRLTILTGANGAGKSSLLRIFSRHFGFDRPFLATPIRDKEGHYSYDSGIFSGAIAKLWRRFRGSKLNQSEIGLIKYDNGAQTNIVVPTANSAQYSINFSNHVFLPGIHIDSHAIPPVFQQVSQIPTTVINPAAAFNSYNGEIVSRYTGGYSGNTPTFRMKEAIIAMAMFGEGNSQVKGNPEVLKAFRGYVSVLKRMLPESLGFIDISIRPPEVVLETKTGEFMIDAASGGIATIIDLSWRLHMFSLMHSSFVVTIDEPENHLHPTMQRSLMRKLLSAFPQAQFIIATHSPFMISSVKDSIVYVLRYVNSETGEFEGSEKVLATDSSRVVAVRLDAVNKAGTASEILRDVLGVPATVPEWVEDGTQEVVRRYRGVEITQATLTSLREDLKSLGYEDQYASALTTLVEAGI